MFQVFVDGDVDRSMFIVRRSRGCRRRRSGNLVSDFLACINHLSRLFVFGCERRIFVVCSRWWSRCRIDISVRVRLARDPAEGAFGTR